MDGRGERDLTALGVWNGGEMGGIDRMCDVFAMDRAEMYGGPIFLLSFRRQKHD